MHSDVEPVGVVKCDFNDIVGRASGQTARDARVGPLSVCLELSEHSLTFEILHKKTVLRGAHLETSIRTDAQRSRGGQAERDWRREF